MPWNCEKVSFSSNFISLLQSASHVPTQAEREAAMEEMKQRKEALQNASEERKNFMQTMELKRKENAKPSDLEQVTKHNVCIALCELIIETCVPSRWHYWSKGDEVRNLLKVCFVMNWEISLTA